MSDDDEPVSIRHANRKKSFLIYRVVRVGNRHAKNIAENRRCFVK